MSTKTKFTNLNKSYQNLRVTKKLVINPQDTLIALKRSLKLIKDTSKKGGTILLVGNNTKYKQIMQSYALDVQQPFIYRNWVNGILSNETLLKNHLVTYGFKIDRSPMSDWLRRNKVSDFLMKYEGCINHLEKPSLVIFLNTSQLSDALDEVNSLKIPTVGLTTTSMDASRLNYPIPSNDQSIKTLTSFVELVKRAIKEGSKERKLILKRLATKESLKSRMGNRKLLEEFQRFVVKNPQVKGNTSKFK